MGELQDRAARDLRAIVDGYAAAEAAVVRAYFDRLHSTEENLDVLLRQMGREIQAVNRLPHAAEMFEGLEITVERHDFADLLEHIAEETSHYVILADLAEWLADRKLGPDELRKYEICARWFPDLPPQKQSNPLLPDASRIMELSRVIVEKVGLQRAAALTRLSEGGGGGAYAECARLAGDPFRERLAAAMHRILSDEMEHGPGHIDDYANTWVRSEAELEEDHRWLQTFMAQHVRVRNEIWNYPLSAERLAALGRAEGRASSSLPLG